jgi:biotin-(acetyl-CoA carboxylase) ligase
MGAAIRTRGLEEAIQEIQERLHKLESQRLSKGARDHVKACQQLCDKAVRSLDAREWAAAAAQLSDAHGYLHVAERTQKTYAKRYEQIAKSLQATRHEMFERDYPALAKRLKHSGSRWVRPAYS